MKLLKEAEMRAIKLVGLMTLVCASSAFAADVVTWNARAVVTDFAGVEQDMNALNPAALPPIDNGDGTFSPNGLLMQWTVSCVVTGDNQGLGGAMVAMGVKNTANPAVWAPFVQPGAGVSFATVYKAPGTAVNGSVADSASAGGLGAGAGGNVGYAADSFMYVAQMGMGYLSWSARRYKTTPLPKAWIGDQQWGMGLDSRKTAILADPAGTFDLVQGFVDITAVAAGTYKSEFDMPNITSKVLAAGVNLNSDQPSVDFVDATVAAGDFFQFTIVPEPATMLLLAGAGLLVRRRRA